MNPRDVLCPNIDCPARGWCSAGNVSVRSQEELALEKSGLTGDRVIFQPMLQCPI
jgi:hypothetical protein